MRSRPTARHRVEMLDDEWEATRLDLPGAPWMLRHVPTDRVMVAAIVDGVPTGVRKVRSLDTLRASIADGIGDEWLVPADSVAI